MTDEMRIQQRPSALPYMAGGALAGGAAGWAVDKYALSKPMSHEDIIKKMNDADAFTKNTAEGAEHAASWKDVQAKAKAVEDAKAAVAEAEKGLPTDTKITETFNSTKEAYEANLKTLEEAERARLAKGKPGNVSNTPIEFDKLNISGTAAERTHLQNQYNSLKTSYESAATRVQNTINAGVGNTRTQRLNEINNYLENEFTRYGTYSEDTINTAFNKKTQKHWTSGWLINTPTPQYQRALNVANNIYPDFTRASLTDEHYLQFGQQIERGTTVPSGYNTTHVTITDPVTHRPKKIGVMYKNVDLQNFVDAESKKVAEQRIAYADELFNNARESVLLQRQKSNLPTEYANGVEKGLANSTGLYRPATATTPEAFDFTQIKREAAGTRTYTTRRGATLTGFEADIRNLNDAIRNAGTGTPTMPAATNLNGSYAAAGGDVQKALDMAKARKAVIEKYNKQANALTKEIDLIATSNSVIADLDAQIANIRATDKGLQKARAKFLEKFPEVFGKAGEATAYTEAEIEAKIKAYLDKNADPILKQKFEQAKLAYENAIKEGATQVDPAKTNAAKEALTKAETEFKSATESLGKKLGKGGNKLLAIGIGAAALGLGALALRPKNNA